MKIVLDIKEPYHDPQGMKEAIAMRLEPLGGKIAVVSVEPSAADQKEQMKINLGGSSGHGQAIHGGGKRHG